MPVACALMPLVGFPSRELLQAWWPPSPTLAQQRSVTATIGYRAQPALALASATPGVAVGHRQPCQGVRYIQSGSAGPVARKRWVSHLAARVPSRTAAATRWRPTVLLLCRVADGEPFPEERHQPVEVSVAVPTDTAEDTTVEAPAGLLNACPTCVRHLGAAASHRRISKRRRRPEAKAGR